MLMGYNKLPIWRDYWNTSNDLCCPLVSKAMTRQRFGIILKYLHCNDNAAIPADNKDRLFKIRPFIDGLNTNFRSFYNGTSNLSVDESMILFKGRNTMKQYCPMKPTKRGYKMWCLADQRGYIKKFSIYQGKDGLMEDKWSGFGLGERVVLSMTEDEWNKNKIVYFDNYFTSLPVLEKLRHENMLACGTIRLNRKGTPQNMVADKSMKRGDWDYRVSSTDITYFKWMDSKAIYLASNFHGTESSTGLDGIKKVCREK